MPASREPANVTPNTVTMRVSIQGRFCQTTFVPWIQARARRLGVASHLTHCTDQRIEITASGYEILVDALALACTLGPISATVDDVETSLLN